jgi:hypothetical protein
MMLTVRCAPRRVPLFSRSVTGTRGRTTVCCSGSRRGAAQLAKARDSRSRGNQNREKEGLPSPMHRARMIHRSGSATHSQASGPVVTRLNSSGGARGKTPCFLTRRARARPRPSACAWSSPRACTASTTPTGAMRRTATGPVSFPPGTICIGPYCSRCRRERSSSAFPRTERRMTSRSVESSRCLSDDSERTGRAREAPGSTDHIPATRPSSSRRPRRSIRTERYGFLPAYCSGFFTNFALSSSQQK